MSKSVCPDKLCLAEGERGKRGKNLAALEPYVLVVIDHSKKAAELFLIDRQSYVQNSYDFGSEGLNAMSGYPETYIYASLGLAKKDLAALTLRLAMNAC